MPEEPQTAVQPAPVPWDEDAREFLSRLAVMCRAAGFVVLDGFAHEPNQHWIVSLPLKGKIGLVDLELWTSPALAALGQWRMRLTPRTADEGIPSVVHGVDLSEFGYLLRYLSAVAMHAETLEAARSAMRYSKDPRHAADREQLLMHAERRSESRGSKPRNAS